MTTEPAPDVPEVVLVEESIQRRLDRNFRWMLVIVLLLLGGGAGELANFENQQSKQNTAADGQCRRVQRLRDIVNWNSNLQDQGFKIVATALTDSDRLHRLTPGERDLDTLEAAALRHSAAAILHEAQTDCRAAVASPNTYTPPLPIPYGP